MSYDEREKSRYLGQPVEGFRFAQGSNLWFYTSADRAITLPAGAVTVTETAVAGTSVQAIAGTPAAPTNINLAGRSATVQVAAGRHVCPRRRYPEQ